MKNFIELMVIAETENGFQKQKISVENIHRFMQQDRNFTAITLREIADGNNVVVKTTKTYDEIEDMITRAQE